MDIFVPAALLLFCFQTVFTQCPSEYAALTPTHTMCLADRGSEIPISEQNRVDAVDRHNLHRGQVTPSAANMQKLVWDENLARVATKWAKQCVMGHDNYKNRAEPNLPNVFIGQNGAFGYQNLVAATDAWASEIVNFTYGVKDDRIKGHYVQMIQAVTTHVGCGIADCKGRSALSPFIFCNYARGLVSTSVYAYPFEKSTTDTSCSACTGNCDTSGKLCDCGGKMCMNGGSLTNPATCACACTWGWRGDTCTEKICPASDASSCQYYLKLGYNCIYPQVEQEKCPYTCGFCP